jgi:hypothetical protein
MRMIAISPLLSTEMPSQVPLRPFDAISGSTGAVACAPVTQEKHESTIVASVTVLDNLTTLSPF